MCRAMLSQAFMQTGSDCVWRRSALCIMAHVLHVMRQTLMQIYMAVLCRLSNTVRKPMVQSFKELTCQALNKGDGV